MLFLAEYSEAPIQSIQTITDYIRLTVVPFFISTRIFISKTL